MKNRFLLSLITISLCFVAFGVMNVTAEEPPADEVSVQEETQNIVEPEWEIDEGADVTASLAATTVLSGSCGENVNYMLDSNGVLTISGSGVMENYYSYSPSPWVSQSSSIKTVVIEKGVASIGNRAFFDCSSLISVTIPDSVTSIGSEAFSYCGSLTSVTIPGSVTTIGGAAFVSCSSLTSVTIGDNVVRIGAQAFAHCSRLTSVIIPDSVTSIGYYAFNNCSNLTSVTIGDNVASIEEHAFNKCSSVTSITIPKSITTIEKDAFEYCSSLTDVYITDLDAWCRIEFENYASNPMYYADELYINGEPVTSVVIPNDVTRINDYIFHGCNSLTSVTIPDSVTSIGSGAFYGCNSLKLVIYKGTKEQWDAITIGTNNTALTAATIVFDTGEYELYPTDGGMLGINNRTIKAYYGSDTEVTIPTEVNGIRIDEIANDVFANGETIEKINIPEGITRIGKNAFAGTAYYKNAANWENGTLYIDSYLVATNSSLPASYAIKPGTTAIASYAFASRTGLMQIALPDGLTNIDNYAFSGCSNLRFVLFPKSIARVGYNAFSGISKIIGIQYCGAESEWAAVSVGDGNESLSTPTYFSYNIQAHSVGESIYVMDLARLIHYYGNETDLTIPASINGQNLRAIGDNAFLNNTALKTVSIPDTVIFIAYQAFRECSNLSAVKLPSSLTELGSSCFHGCNKLATISLPDSLEKIGDSAFCNSGLRYIIIPDSVTEIENGAFWECSQLQAVSIGNSVEFIGFYAFADCDSLKEVIIPDSVVRLDELGGQFMECDSLKKVTIGQGIKVVPYSFLYNSSNVTELNFTNSTTIFMRESLTCESRYGVGKSWLFLDAINYVGTPAQFSQTLVSTYEDENTLLCTDVNYISSLSEVADMGSKYVVEYDLNGGSGNFDFVMQAVGKPVVIPQTNPTRSGYVFGGWSTKADGSTPEYLGGDSYTQNQNIKLYAVWGKTTFSVGSQMTQKGKTIQIPVTLSYTPGISNISFKVNYDKTKMQLKSITNGNVFTASQLEFGPLTTSPCAVYFDDYDRNNLKNGTLITLEFTILESCPEGDYDITLSNISAKTISGSSVSFELENSTIAVRDYILGDADGDGKCTISVNGHKFDFLSTQSATTFYVALYSKSGRIKEIKSFNAVDGLDVFFDDLEPGDYTKVMYWETSNTAVKPTLSAQEIVLK